MFKHQIILGVFALVPSLLLCFAVLSTFYRPSSAYLAISWVPAVLYFGVIIFLNDPGHILNEYDLNLLLESVVWTSLVQAVLGVGLLIRAIARKEDRIVILAATLISALPFVIKQI